MASTIAAYPKSEISPSRKVFPLHLVLTSAVVRDVFAAVLLAAILFALCMVPA